MTSNISTYDDVIKNVATLSPEEKLRLIIYLAEATRQNYREKQSGRYWREIKGATTYPLLEEDAQKWISENRQSSEQNREQQWSNDS